MYFIGHIQEPIIKRAILNIAAIFKVKPPKVEQKTLGGHFILRQSLF